MSEPPAVLRWDGKEIELPIVRGSEGECAIDISKLRAKTGYVTFDPTEFKIGDLSIPVSLLNSALQKKLAEQREQLKLPPGIASLRVANSELVITQK